MLADTAVSLLCLQTVSLQTVSLPIVLDMDCAMQGSYKNMEFCKTG